MSGCLFLCVSPVIDWQPVWCNPASRPSASWDWLQLPSTGLETSLPEDSSAASHPCSGQQLPQFPPGAGSVPRSLSLPRCLPHIVNVFRVASFHQYKYRLAADGGGEVVSEPS